MFFKEVMSMMKWIFGGLMILSVFFAIFTGNIGNLNTAILSECGNAVALCISLCGIICFWSGIMQAAKKAGIVDFLGRLFRPVIKHIYKGIDVSGKAMGYIVLNLTANMLGLGNASTPFGLAAMSELQKEECCGDTASDNMIMFVVMNTASLQIIPTTAAALRLKNGSAAPMEILPCVWIVSAASVTAVILLAKLFGRIFRKK